MPSGARPKLIYVATEDWYFWAHRLALGRAALDAGYEVIVAARVRDHGDRLAAVGFRVVALPWRRGDGSLLDELRALLMLWRLFRRQRPAIVHLLALKPIIYGGLMARLAGIGRRVHTVAGLGYVFTSNRRKALLLRPAVVLALRAAIGGAGSIVQLENADDGRVLVAHGAIDQTRIGLVCCVGVDVDRFVPVPEPAGPPIVGMACRLVRDKGAGVAVAAMRLLGTDGTAPEFRLAGGLDPGNPDSLTEGELQAWVDSGLVRRCGHVDDMVAFWQGCHIVLYPSRYGEGVPKTLLEAAACARPIVTTDMPGCRDAIEDGITGRLVPVDDPAAIVEALKPLLADPVLRRRFGAAGRAKAEAEFADPVVVRKILALYRHGNAAPTGAP